MVKTPGITNSQEQQDYLMDIASVTGGVYLNVKSWQTDISKVPVEKLVLPLVSSLLISKMEKLF